MAEWERGGERGRCGGGKSAEGGTKQEPYFLHGIYSHALADFPTRGKGEFGLSNRNNGPWGEWDITGSFDYLLSNDYFLKGQYKKF
jgi:hypothetical protein